VLLPGVAGVELAREMPGSAAQESAAPRAGEAPVSVEALSPMSEAFHGPVQQQVSIEQRITIRVAPRAPIAPGAFDSLPANGVGPRFTEKKMGKCIPVSGIVGVQYRDANRLVLYLRDRRMISATLEKSCSARDFYSGFYVARNDDGQLCVQRDAILSRSGANCQISGLKQLVEDDD
jgi:hypothetical protein